MDFDEYIEKMQDMGKSRLWESQLFEGPCKNIELDITLIIDSGITSAQKVLEEVQQAITNMTPIEDIPGVLSFKITGGK